MPAFDTSLRPAAVLAALLLGAAAHAAGTPPADPDLLEFLGELNGEDAVFVEYTATSDARRALKKAGQGEVPPSVATPVAPAPIAWDELDAPTQALLAGQAQAWAGMPATRQRALVDGAQRWSGLDGIGRAQANERWQTWRSLTPGQRKRMRKAWERFRVLDPEQQRLVREAFFRHQHLPVDERRSVSDRWMSMTPEEQMRAIERQQAPGPQPGAVDKRPCPTC